ncbi:hypothetical protein AB1Y20_017961 [Prymnesium parvum]|uniref:NAD-dependent epimerase/dehydratase domain-containing protein n=1 Tax=Prymnesium parvum TaxID=97485 RepID=A0AB34JQM4_PRYPA
MAMAAVLLAAVASAAPTRLAVTGASGYLGAEIVWQAVAQGHSVTAIVRDAAAAARVLPRGTRLLPMADLTEAAAAARAAEGVDAVIHTASVFRRCADMEAELVLPNLRMAEAMARACAASGARLVLTSSMAAVRGATQPPRDGVAYTVDDWNRVSRRSGGGMEAYQYSKMASERRAREMAAELGVELVCLCPSMILGPPRDAASSCFSVEMVRRWLDGTAPVSSLLVCDVRDCAAAHINAAVAPRLQAQRYIVSCEARLAASDAAEAIRNRVGHAAVPDMTADDAAGAGIIPVGQQEVVALAGLQELGVECRPNELTYADMAESLLQSQPKEVLRAP